MSWYSSHTYDDSFSTSAHGCRTLTDGIYLEIPCWPLEVPSGIQMRLWSPGSECWLQTQPPPGSAEQKQKINNLTLMLLVCNYPHYLLVGSVIIAGMSSSFSSIQCGYPVWSLNRSIERMNKKNLKPTQVLNIHKRLLEYCPAKVRMPPSSARPRW